MQKNVKVVTLKVSKAQVHDIESVIARTFWIARKQIPKDSKYKVWGYFLFTRIDDLRERDVHVTSRTYNSDNLEDMFDELSGRIRSKEFYEGVIIKEVKYSFALIPKGSGCATSSRDRESILNKRSVLRIINDDNNCFWYALACLMNPENKSIKDHRNKARVKVAKELCNKCKLQFDEPVCFITFPVIEKALDINIYVIDLNNLPMLKSAINIWNSLI